MQKKETRPATITGNRVSRGGRGDAFQLDIIDMDGRGISVELTPEQWALALWGRGDIVIKATFIHIQEPPEVESDADYANRICEALPEGAVFTAEDLGDARGEDLDRIGAEWNVIRRGASAKP